MNVQRILRSRWLPGVLALGIAVLTGFYAYKIYNRTIKHKPGDFRHFYYAGEAINQGEDIYAAGEKGYIYPPLFAVLMSPLARLDQITAERVWAGANGLLIAGIMGIAFRDAVRRFGIPADRVTLRATFLIALLLTLDQVRWELEMGQSDTIVLLGFALGLFWLDRYPVLSGFAIGLAANVKYQSLIAVPYLLLRRRFAAAGAAVASTAGWALLPAIWTGWDANLQNLGTALGRLGWVVGLSDAGADAHMHPSTWINSVSLTSAAARYAEAFGAGSAFVVAVIGITAAAMVGVCWAIYRRRGVSLLVGRAPAAESSAPLSGVVALEWYGLIVAVLVFGPQSMVRHSFLLLPVHILIAALIMAPRVGVARWPLVAGALIFQLGTKLPPGEDMFARSLETWRYFGGSSWCMLVMYASLLWVGLEYAKAVAAGRPLVHPPEPGRAVGGDTSRATRGEH